MRYYWYLYIFVWKPHSEIHRLYIHTVPEKLFLFVLPYGFVFEELHGWAVKFSRKNQLWGPGGFSLMNWFRFHPGFSACNIHTAGRRIVTVGNLKAAFFCWTDPPIYIHSYIYIYTYIYISNWEPTATCKTSNHRMFFFYINRFGLFWHININCCFSLGCYTRGPGFLTWAAHILLLIPSCSHHCRPIGS